MGSFGSFHTEGTIGVPIASKTYAGALAADIDCIALGDACCRKLRVATAGNVTLLWESGVSDTIALPDNGELIGSIRKVVQATTTAQGITVFW